MSLLGELRKLQFGTLKNFAEEYGYDIKEMLIIATVHKPLLSTLLPFSSLRQILNEYFKTKHIG